MKTFNPKFLIAIFFIILGLTGTEIFAGIGENSNTNKEDTCFIKKISKNSFSEGKFNSICYGKIQFFKKKKSIKGNSIVKVRLVKTDSPKTKNIIEVNNASSFILEAVPGKYKIIDIFFNGKYYKIGKTFELLKDYLTDLGIIKVKLFKESLKEYSYNIEIISRLNKYMFTRDEKLRALINAIYPQGTQGTSDIKLFIPNWNNAPKASFTDSKTLFKAAENGDLSSLRSFIKEKFDINIQDDKGWTPFMFALFNNQKEIAELLLKEGVNVNLKTKNNWTALMFALRYKQPEIARLLIEKGAKINAQNNNLWTPLMFALCYDHGDIADLLISKGADINVKDNENWTPLLYALRYEHKQIAKLLIEKGVDLNIKNKSQWSPLMMALRYNQPENARLFIQKGADINSININGWTPLLFALQYGQKENARELLNKGAKINIKNKNGWTPLMIALRYGQTEIVKLLIKKKANIHEKNRSGWTPLLFALRNDQRENAQLLIKKGANINTKTTDGITPLMLALQYDQQENARLLIIKGAEINVKNQIGWTPLMLALRYNQPENAKLLIQKGADINVKTSDSWSPLMYALRYEQPENAKLLIEKGADVNISIKGGWTPLLFAINFKQPENAKILIEKGADVNVKNSNGDSPLSLARKNDYREIVLLLDKSPKSQVEKEQPWLIKRGFPIPANTININSGKCGAMSQSCFADLEINSTKKQAFDSLKTQLQKEGWIIDQAFHATNESSSLKKPEIWGIINVNKDLYTLTYLIPSDKAKKYINTHIILTFFDRGAADKIADFVSKIPKIRVLKNDMSKKFKYKLWAVKVLSATNAGNLIKKTKYFNPMRPYTFRNNNPNTYLLRVKIELERLDEKPIKKSFMTDVRVRDTAGNVYDWIGAGSENGEYYDRRRSGVQSLLIPMQPKSDDVEYVFSIPNNVLICEFVWQSEAPIGITVK